MRKFPRQLGAARKRGFSAVEVVVAATIMLILTTISLVGYRVYQHQMPVKFMAQRLVHGFGAARAFAISHNSTYSVQLDTVHRVFWIDQTDDNGIPVVPKVVGPEPFDEKVDIDGLQFASGEPVQGTRLTIPVRFFPDGSSDDLHLFLRMKSDAGATSGSIYTVRLYGPTGLSKLFEEPAAVRE